MNKKRKILINVRTKVILFVTVVALILSSIGVALGYMFGHDLLRKTVGEDYEEMAKLLAVSFGVIFDEEVVYVESLINIPLYIRAIMKESLFYREMGEDQKNRYFEHMDEKWKEASGTDSLVIQYTESEEGRRLRETGEKDENISEVFITDRFGGLVAASGKTSDFYQADEEWWQKAYDGGKGRVYVGDVEFDESAGELAITIAAPIKDRGQVIGVGKAVINIKNFLYIMNKFRIRDKGYAVMTDRDGNILFHRGVEPFKTRFCGYEEFQGLMKGKERWKVMEGNGTPHIIERRFVAFAEVASPILKENDIKWIVFIVDDAKEVFAPLTGLASRLMIIQIVIIFLAVLLSGFFSGLFVRPIRRLSKATKEIMGGNWDYEIRVKSRDEIEELADSFREMVSSLKYKQAELVFAKEQLLDSAHTLEKKVREKTKDLVQAQEAAINIMEDLEESKTYIENILANFLDTLIIVGMDGSIQSVNQVALNLLGYQDAELGEKPFGTVFEDEKEGGILIDGFRQHAGEEEPYKLLNYETSYKRKDGTLVPVLLSGTVMLDKDGRPMGIVIVAKDITSRKQAEEALRLGQLGKLVADMAHEVNNPLMIISGRAQISMLTGMDSKALGENCKIIMDQCQRARDIIQRLLLFSKPSKGEIKEVDIKDVIDFVVELIEHQFELVNINIVKKYARVLPHMKIDEKQLHEVLINVLKNSAEAMPEGGTITVAAAREWNNIRIDISDTGQGIETKDLMRIFDPFFTTKEKGTGLGLSVCYGIIKVYGGDMRCSSKPGEGTTMTILLPITQQ